MVMAIDKPRTEVHDVFELLVCDPDVKLLFPLHMKCSCLGKLLNLATVPSSLVLRDEYIRAMRLALESSPAPRLL